MKLRYPFNGTYEVTLGFGETFEGLYSAKNTHKGVDFGCPQGTEILAAADGKVYKVGYEKDGYGNYIILQHGSYGTVYAHLNAIYVQIGSDVKAGDVIAHSGNTGGSTGPHLHFEARTQAEKIDTVYDPLPDMQSVTVESTDTGTHRTSGGMVKIVCDQANVRSSSSYNVCGCLNRGAVLNVSENYVMYKNLPYRSFGDGLFLIAEYDSYGTQIIESV